MAKKFNAAKRAKRPNGMKGKYKQVDPRMKSDTKKKRGNATEKKGKKRGIKGKKLQQQQQSKQSTRGK